MKTNCNPEQYLNDLLKELLECPKMPVGLNSEWARSKPDEPGVYLLWYKKKIMYAGETGNIRGRMLDMTRTVNHTVRRSIGSHLFSDVDGFVKATSKRRFIDAIEDMVNHHMKNNLKISTLQVPLGRKELEEKVISIYKPLYNQKKARQKIETYIVD